MAKQRKTRRKHGASSKPIDLSGHFDWPKRLPKDEWWRGLAEDMRGQPRGRQTCWGLPFDLAAAKGPNVIQLAKSRDEVTIRLNRAATHLCFLHTWRQIPVTTTPEDPTEGLAVGEYEINYVGGDSHVQPIRGRFETAMAESPGPPWLAMPIEMGHTVDPAGPVADGSTWGRNQTGIGNPPWTRAAGYLVYALVNPQPDRRIRSVTLRGLQDSPLLVAGLTLYQGSAHPLRHLPRRTYRVKVPGKQAAIEQVEVDLGIVARTEKTDEPRNQSWLKSPYKGDGFTPRPDQPDRGEKLFEIVGAPDATVSVQLAGRQASHDFSLGETFEQGRSRSRGASLEVLGQQRQWLQVKVVDTSTGKPTPTRIHFSGGRGEYPAPYGHQSQVNTNWFEDYGADVVVGGRSYAYVPGEFPTDLPVGEVFVEANKGFEYECKRQKVTIRPGQRTLELKIDRWQDLRRDGWVTADTHVHFLSPHTAWLEGQAEGVNVVNLLASQWGRLFTNVGDITGRVGVVEDDTIVYVGTENRNHMLGHMSMLGTKGNLPVYPMCCGGPGEAWVGDPDFRTLAEWARENKRKGGVVVRPHYPFCGHTEDPVPILSGLVDALEINPTRAGGLPVQEWYRYLNCGYRVAVAGGTDKMEAYTALGCLRTYAQIEPGRRFTYASWGRAMRAGRTLSTNGPLMQLSVDGRAIGDSIEMSARGGTVEVQTVGESSLPLGVLEIVCNGKVVAAQRGGKGARRLCLKERVRVPGSGWIAARCSGPGRGPGGFQAAHTSPVYIKCGDTRAFDGPAAEHMLALVEGGTEYLNTLATTFDEPSRKRMVKLFNEARAELKGRLLLEGGHAHQHGNGVYHTHGHDAQPDHMHE